MKTQKKIILIIIIFLVIISPLSNEYSKNLTTVKSSTVNAPIRVSVLISSFRISFFKLLSEDMKKIEQENPATVEYTFYDGKDNESLQDSQLNDVLTKKKCDLLMIDMVNIPHTINVINKVKEFNIPVIFLYNGDPEAIKSYGKAFLAGTDSRETGIVEGNITVQKWNKDKKTKFKVQDNILNYILLLSTPNSSMSSDRGKYAILTINNNGIETQELGSKFCYWNEAKAKEATRQYILKFGNKIDAIISIEDSMAIGAVKALQEYGYNLGNKEKTITVVGCDGLPEALDLIKKGFMTGTVKQDISEIAKDLYIFGINLFNNKNIIDGTNCTIDNSGKIITIPALKPIVNLD